MSTVNGFGTQYYGWEHHNDGTATATKWLVAGFFPIIPFGSARLRVIQSEPVKGVPWFSEYQNIGRAPVSLRRVFLTYVYAYLILLPLLIAPATLSYFAFSYFFPDYSGPKDETPSQQIAMFTLVVGNIGYAAFIASYVLDRASGRKKW